jgi:ribosomal protein S18 acetylase RimI-like enzyme
MEVKIRKAKKEDFKGVIKLIIELAEFEKLAPPDNKAKKRLYNDAFGTKPKYFLIVAERNKELVGYAFYFFTYSSFLARPTLYLEDIYISHNTRGEGIGKKMMNELIKISEKNKCGRLEWCVLNWNKKAIDFYDKLGAKPLKEWIYYRFEF